MYDQRLFNQPNAATGYGVGDEEGNSLFLFFKEKKFFF